MDTLRTSTGGHVIINLGERTEILGSHIVNIIYINYYSFLKKWDTNLLSSMPEQPTSHIFGTRNCFLLKEQQNKICVFSYSSRA